MQIEQPHHPPSGFRDFIRQYAMIVLSILTALALERAAVSLQNAALARASRARIEAEIASVRSDVVAAKKSNEEQMARISGLAKSLVKEISDGKPNTARLLDLAKQAMDQVSIKIPDYPRDAWDTAIADQSATHLDPADLARYSKIYTQERNEIAFETVLLQGDLIGQLASIGVDARMGNVDPQLAARALGHLIVVMQIINHQDDELIKLIDRPAVR